MATAVNALAKCGAWPMNPDVFSDADYIAADTTDRPQDVQTSTALADSKNKGHTGRSPHRFFACSLVHKQISRPSYSGDGSS